MTNSVKMFSCNICGNKTATELGRRSDGLAVLKCNTCGLGVVETILDDLSKLYEDDYYGTTDQEANSHGYSDYDFAAEHRVSWVAALIEAIGVSGTVLDVGCADGHLLKQLMPKLSVYGIEMNEFAATKAQAAGTRIIASDLFDPNIAVDFAGSFDVVTSVATLEHLTDLRGGVFRMLDLLKEDGLLIFEVPLISNLFDNGTWYTSSLEHVYYPTESALRHLFDEQLEVPMIGCEINIRRYASTYVGIASRSRVTMERIGDTWQRIAAPGGRAVGRAEKVARVELHVLHAAQTEPELVDEVGSLDPVAINSLKLARMAQLWKIDGEKLRTIERDRQYYIQQARNWQRVAGELNTQALLSSAEQEKRESEIKEQHYRSIASNAERKRLAATRAEVARLREQFRSRLDRERKQLAAARSEVALLREQVRSLRGGLARLLGLRLQRVVKNPLLYSKIAVLSGLDRLATWSPDKAAALRKLSRRTWWVLTRQWDRRPEEAENTSPANAHDVSDPVTERDSGVVARDTPPAGPLSTPVEKDPIPFTCDPHPEGDPLVSVIVPCFNYGRFVREAIASVDAQTFENLEIIVVEGGSTDGTTRETVCSLTGPRLRVLLRDEPHRVGDNRNYGIERARGKYICCLDADDKLHPTYIEKSVFIMEHYSYDVVSSAVQMFGESNERYAGEEYVDLDSIVRSNQMSTGAVFRRKYWEMAGGYRDYGDGSAGTHLHEDWSLWMRMAAVGARMINFSRDYLFLYNRHGQCTLSGRPGVVPMNEQRAALLEANGDVIFEEALQRSKRERLSSYHATNGLVNFRPQTGDRRRKSIVVALPFMVLGGAERLLSQVFRHLTARGWDISIVTTIDPESSAGDTTSWFEEGTARIYHLPRFLYESQWEDFIDYLLVARSVSTLWVIGSEFVYHLLPALKRKHPDLRVIDLLFNTVGHTASNRRYGHLIDRIFVENGEVKAWLLTNGEREERITIISSGANVTEFRPEGKSQAILKALEIKPSDLVVGFSGRWSPEKDPVGFVHIAALLAGRRSVRFIMTGAGSLETEILHALSITPALDDRFHLLENVPDIREVLACFDVLVLPSRLDGRPVVVLEALATGVPVIASRVGGLPELITPGQTGELCAPGDYTAFASVIARLNKDRLLLAQLKRNARSYAEAYLNADDTLRRYESELDELYSDQLELVG